MSGVVPADVPDEVLAALGRYTTPAVVNGLKRLGEHPSAIESLDRRAVRCMAPELGPRVGFAATRVVATRRHDLEVDRAQAASVARIAHELLLGLPGPRFLAVQNVGDWQGPVAIWGEIGATMNVTLKCVAGVTNGPVRDLVEMERAGFVTFADGPGVGGGFVDPVSAGEPVTIAGVEIAHGDLLHGDRHGVVKIPLRLAADLPAAVDAVERGERDVLAVCRSSDFTLQALADVQARAAH